jgi:hypothetical protein
MNDLDDPLHAVESVYIGEAAVVHTSMFCLVVLSPLQGVGHAKNAETKLSGMGLLLTSAIRRTFLTQLG